MTYLTICQPCQEGRHDDCEVSVDPPTPEQLAEGFCGGGHCVCAHGGDETSLQREVRERVGSKA